MMDKRHPGIPGGEASRGIRALVAAAMLAIVVTGGCDRDGSEAAPVESVTRTAADGPVSVTTTVTPAKLALTDRATVEVEVRAESGVIVEVGDHARQLTAGDRAFELRILPKTRLAAEPQPDGRLRWLHQYELSFYLPGSYELPGAEVTWYPPQAQDDEPTPPRRLRTEPLTIEVRDVHATGLSPEELAEIPTLEPVDLPPPGFSWPAWLAAGAILLAAGVLLMLLRRRRQQAAAAAVVIPAHEWAWARFAALEAEDLLGRGEVQAFYYRVSDIVRGYIERRFALSAPEMTTEEFLAVAAEDRRIDAGHTEALRTFLTACDLVKYARHEPTPDESRGVLRAGRDFVEATRVRLEPETTVNAATARERAA